MKRKVRTSTAVGKKKAAEEWKKPDNIPYPYICEVYFLYYKNETKTFAPLRQFSFITKNNNRVAEN